MAAEIKYTIPQLTEAITDGLIKVSNTIITNDELGLIKKGRIDVPASGEVVYPMDGTGVSIGDDVNVNIKNYNGANATTSGVSELWLKVTDDGVAPAPFYILQATGDSITDQGSSNNSSGDRDPTLTYSTSLRGYWIQGPYAQSSSDYVYRPDTGGNGATISTLITQVDRILSRDADVVIMMAGINDILGGANAATVISRWDEWIGLLYPAKKLVICKNQYQRFAEVNYVARNLILDEVNAHLQSVADANPFIDVVEPSALFNSLILSGDTSVAGDLLHPTNYGASLMGVNLNAKLQELYPSTVSGLNLLPPLTGTGGTKLSGATGVAPDGYFVEHGTAVPDGFQYVDVDGKQWLQVTTDGAFTGQRFQGFSGVLATPVPSSGWYVFYVTMYVESGAELMHTLKVVTRSSGTSGDSQMVSYLTGGQVMQNGVERRFQSPPILMNNGDSIDAYLVTVQNAGVNLVYRATDYEVRKVEDI